jgi:hypothetical protein
MLIIIIISCLMACASSADAKSDVEIVMNGRLAYDRSMTIGDAFNNFRYFQSIKWRVHQDENKKRLVIFIGTLDLGKLKQYRNEINALQAAFIRTIFVINNDNSIEVKSFSYQVRLPKQFKLVDWSIDTPDNLKYSVLNIYKNDYKSGLIISNELIDHLTGL